jgi:hypothetical protein
VRGGAFRNHTGSFVSLPLLLSAPLRLELDAGAGAEFVGGIIGQSAAVIEQVSRVILAQFDRQGLGFPIRAFVVGPAALQGLVDAGSALEHDLMVTRLITAHLVAFAQDRNIEVLVSNGDVLLETAIGPATLSDHCSATVKLKAGKAQAKVLRTTALKASGGFGGLAQTNMRGTIFLGGEIDLAMYLNAEATAQFGKKIFHTCLPSYDKSFPFQIETQGKVWVGLRVYVSNVKIEERNYDPNGLNLLLPFTTPRPGSRPLSPGVLGIPGYPLPAGGAGYYPAPYPFNGAAPGGVYAGYGAPGVVYPGYGAPGYGAPGYGAPGFGRREGTSGTSLRTRIRDRIRSFRGRKRRKRQTLSAEYGAPSYSAPATGRTEKFLVFKIKINVDAEIKHWDVDRFQLKGCHVKFLGFKVFDYCAPAQTRIASAVTRFATEFAEKGLPPLIDAVEYIFNTAIGSEIAIPLLLADENAAILSTIFQKVDAVSRLKADLLKDLGKLVKTHNLLPSDPIEFFADTASVFGEVIQGVGK